MDEDVSRNLERVMPFCRASVNKLVGHFLTPFVYGDLHENALQQVRARPFLIPDKPVFTMVVKEQDSANRFSL